MGVTAKRIATDASPPIAHGPNRLVSCGWAIKKPTERAWRRGLCLGSRLYSDRPLFHQHSFRRGIQLLVETTPEELLARAIRSSAGRQIFVQLPVGLPQLLTIAFSRLSFGMGRSSVGVISLLILPQLLDLVGAGRVA